MIRLLATASLCLIAMTAPLAAGDAASPMLAGVDYSPSGIASEATLMRGIPENVIRADLAQLAAITTHVRIYSVAFGLDRVLPIARGLGLKVAVGFDLGPDAVANDAAINHVLAAVVREPAAVDRIFVGNETRSTNKVPADTLIAFIQRVKAAVAGKGIAVGTGEPWHIWLAEPKLAAAADFIGAHIYPYWDGVPVEAGVSYVAQRYDQLRAAYPGKTVVIAETGWPSAGARYQGAVPALDNEAAYIKAFAAAARTAHYDFYICEAYDQPWKAERGDVGAHWGLFDANRVAKFSLR